MMGFCSRFLRRRASTEWRYIMKRLMSVVLVLVMILNSAVPAMAYNIESRWNGVQPFFSYMVQAEGGQPSENLESGFVEMPDYFIASSPTYGSVIKSYLAPNGTDGYIRMEQTIKADIRI